MQKQFGRRRFLTVTGQGALVAAVAAAELAASGYLLTGCGAITIDDVIRWTQIGSSAVSTVLTILGIMGIACAACAVAAPIAIAAIHAIAGAIQEWENPPAGQDKTTLWGKVQLAMRDAVDQVKAFFAASPTLPGGGLANTVMSIASLVLSTIAGFIQQFFPTLGASLAGAKFGTAAIAITPKSLKPDDFKKQFNQLVTSAGHAELVLR